MHAIMLPAASTVVGIFQKTLMMTKIQMHTLSVTNVQIGNQ